MNNPWHYKYEKKSISNSSECESGISNNVSDSRNRQNSMDDNDCVTSRAIKMQSLVTFPANANKNYERSLFGSQFSGISQQANLSAEGIISPASSLRTGYSSKIQAPIPIRPMRTNLQLPLVASQFVPHDPLLMVKNDLPFSNFPNFLLSGFQFLPDYNALKMGPNLGTKAIVHKSSNGAFQPFDSTKSQSGIPSFDHSTNAADEVSRTNTDQRKQTVKPQRKVVMTVLVEQAIRWYPFIKEVNDTTFLFHVAGTLFKVQDGQRPMEKLLLIGQEFNKTKLQCVFYAVDRNLPELTLGQFVGCVGEMIGAKKLRTYDVQVLPGPDRIEVHRAVFLSQRMVLQITKNKTCV